LFESHPFWTRTTPVRLCWLIHLSPLKAHVTSTEKAEGTQMQQRESGIESILADDAGSSISSAGRFKLQTDVTKSRAGSMIRAGANLEKLPFRVYATDILIEGVGWVELVCQVRKGKRIPQVEARTENHCESTGDSAAPAAISIETGTFTPFGGDQATSDPTPLSCSTFPEVEIFTPSGKYVGQRICLDIWQMWNSGKPLRRRYKLHALETNGRGEEAREGGSEDGFEGCDMKQQVQVSCARQS